MRYTMELWARRYNKHYGQPSLPATIFLTDVTRIPDIAAALKQLPKKSMVIIRDYDRPNRADYVRYIIVISRRLGHKVLVGLDEPLAMRYRADGVHFPEWAWRKALYCKRKHPHWMVSASVHSQKGLVRLRQSVDCVLLSPVFPTASHPGDKTLGALGFMRLCARSLLPVYPLGGIQGHSIVRLKASIMPGVAAIGGWVWK